MMKKILLSITSLVVLGFTGCNNQSKTEEQTQNTIKTNHTMKNLVSIIEIPTSDLNRAIKFYSSILGASIEEMEMGGVKMGVLRSDEGTVNVVLAHGSDYTPTQNGSVLYLNAGNNLQPILDKIEPSGGKIIVSKTEISPEMGFFALFIDSEGNKLGLHSLH